MNAAIYHYWSGVKDFPIGRNLRVPIILSIATLRAYNKTLPIYVLDITDPSYPQQEWGDYPKQLNFKVVKWTPELVGYKSYATGWEVCSRFFDVERFAKTIPEKNIMYMDADVFWLQDPLPMRKDPAKFCFNGYNNGFFYYQKDSDAVDKFFEVYKAFTITALNDDNFRYVSRQFSTYNNNEVFVFDEAITAYMYRRQPHLFNVLDSYDHFSGYSIYSNRDRLDHFETDQCKMIHGNSLTVKNITREKPWERNYARGLLCLIFKELFEAASQTIELAEFYTLDEWNLYNSLQISFNTEFISILNKHVTDNRCYEIVPALQSMLK